jgi:hypothetical protein
LSYPLQLVGAVVILLVGLACLERSASTRIRRRRVPPTRPR